MRLVNAPPLSSQPKRVTRENSTSDPLLRYYTLPVTRCASVQGLSSVPMMEMLCLKAVGGGHAPGGGEGPDVCRPYRGQKNWLANARREPAGSILGKR